MEHLAQLSHKMSVVGRGGAGGRGWKINPMVRITCPRPQAKHICFMAGRKENEKKMPTIIDIQINFSVERSLKHLPFENKSCRDNSGIFRLKSFQGREFTHI